MGVLIVALISLKCTSCKGDLNLDDTREFGFCIFCGTKILIKSDVINNYYEIKGKSAEELIADGNKLINIGDDEKANERFSEAIEVEPQNWEAWFGYAQTGGERGYYLSCVPAYATAYNLATIEQEVLTFNSMARYLPDYNMSEALIKEYVTAPLEKQRRMFELVLGVLGCDESEIATLAVDLCPDDWRTWFAKAKFRQIRAKWCERRLDGNALEVLKLFLQAYRLAKNDSENAKNKILTYIAEMGNDTSYQNFARELNNQIKREG